MATPPVAIQIPPRPEYVGVVRLALGSLARTAGLDEEAIDDLRIAISEACTNAVMANEEAGSSDHVGVTWEAQDSSVIVEISDRGREPGPEDDVDTQGFATRTAMAEALLKSLVDDYQVTRTPEGTVTRLVINL